MRKNGFVSSVKSRLAVLGVKGLLAWVGVLILCLILLNLSGNADQTANSIFFPLLFAVGLFLAFSGRDHTIDRGRRLSFWITLSLLLLFCFFVCISFFWLSTASSSSFASLFSNALTRVFSAFGIIGAFLLGYAIRRDGSITLNQFVVALLLVLLFRSLSNLIATLADYGFFHVFRLANYSYYREGVAYPAGEEMAILDGFSVRYVSVEFGSLPFFALAAVLPALLFIKCREQKFLFAFVAVASSFGLLSLLVIGYFEALILLALIYALSLFFRFIRVRRDILTKLTFAAICVAATFVFFLISVAAVGNDIYQSNGFLRRIFDNGRLMMGINQTINAVFSGGPIRIFLGMPAYNYVGFSSIGGYATYTTSLWGAGTPVYWTNFNLHTFEFAALMEGGFLCFLFLCLLLSHAIMSSHRFAASDEECKVGAKSTPILLFFGLTLYQSFCADLFPYVGISNYVSPFVYNSTFVLIVCLIGYMYMPNPFIVRFLSRRKYV